MPSLEYHFGYDHATISVPSTTWGVPATSTSLQLIQGTTYGTLASNEGTGPVLARTWVGSPLTEAVTLNGLATITFNARKAGVYSYAYARAVVRLVSGDGLTERAVLMDEMNGVDMSIGVDPYGFTVELNDVIARVGDRIVVELGAIVDSAGNSRPIEVLTDGDDALILTYTIPPPPKRLVWSSKKPTFRSGVDRGVLYPLEGPGVAWNGLVSVEDAHVGGEFEPLYSDGIRYLNLPSGRNYQATLSAYSTPEEFAPCNGDINVMKGLILTRQPRQQFGLSYRTLVGESLGYQIHLVYNALATPTGRSTTTKTETPTPNIPTWTIDAVPVESYAPRPTAHYILDSTKIGKDQMEAIEGLLYGTAFRNAYLPSIKQITAIATQWDPQIINPIYTTGISPLVDGMGDVQEVDVDGVYILLPNGRLAETEVKGLYQLTE